MQAKRTRNTEGLSQSNQSRRSNNRAQALSAFVELLKKKAHVTPQTVAQEANVSVSSVYKNESIMRRIRRCQTQENNFQQKTHQVLSLIEEIFQQYLELLEANSQLEAENARLEKENKELSKLPEQIN